MIFKDYYKILGLESCKVTNEEIRVAYREQAKKYHPDVIGRDNFSEERFKDINEAYKTLSNTSTRRKYDKMWNSRIGKKQKNRGQAKKEKKSAFAEFFQMFFGEIKNNKAKSEDINGGKAPIKGENIETEITVGIEDAYFGTEKKISLRTVNRKNENFFCKNPIRN